jgi:hypothetical protein
MNERTPEAKAWADWVTRAFFDAIECDDAADIESLNWLVATAIDASRKGMPP